MNRLSIIAISSCLLFCQVADATISIFVDDVTTPVPNVATNVSVPVKLFSDTAVIIEGYDLTMDFQPLPGGFATADPTAVEDMGNFGFAFSTVPNIDLAVSDVDVTLANTNSIVVAPGSTITLFNMNFVVSPSATAGTVVPIIRSPDDQFNTYGVQVLGSGKVQPAFTSGSITVVPEPSQLILGFLMAGLGTVTLVNRYRSRAKKS